jgi:3-hydroxybutyrate dehydrogenase
MSLAGKTALITGSTSGIGLGIAHGFAQAGINVVMNGFGDARVIEKERAALGAQGVQAIYIDADVGRPEAIAVMMEEIVAAFGQLDILVNNAGIQHVSPVEAFPPEEWAAILAVNLSAAFHTSRAAVPLMKQAGWGRIINIASAHGLIASPYKSAYVAAKHGMLGLTKTVALEVAQANITCNAICPGYVYTPLVKKQIPDTARARGMTEDQVINDVLLAAQWTKKFVTVEQLAGTALFLCSEHADNITGTSIAVDGGWTAA